MWAALGAVLLVAAAVTACPALASPPICSETASDVVCNLPSGNNDATLEDDGTGMSKIVSGNHTLATFTNPSNSLTVNGGGSTDSLTVKTTNSFAAANVTIGSEGTVHADSLVTTGTLRITAAGPVDQPTGTLQLGALGVLAAGNVSLPQPTNSIGTFAASDSGPGSGISVNSKAFSVGSVSASGSFAGAGGATTSNGNLALSTTGATLGLSGPVSAGTAPLTATCGDSSAACTIDASGGSLNGSPVTLAGSAQFGTANVNVTDENTTGTGPLIIDGGGLGTASVVSSSVSQSPGSGLVLRNLMGASVTGGNFNANAQEGILLQNAQGVSIGGTGPGQPNVIAGNGTNGVTVGSVASNAITQNSIFGNQGLGISLQNGANRSQTAPTLTAANPSGTSTHVVGSLQSTPSRSFRIEFFDNPACDPSGFAEGRTFIGSANVTTDASGGASFDLAVPGSSGPTDAVAATATDLATGDTSQFSKCIQPSPPLVSIGTPFTGAAYKLGQFIRTSFNCSDGTRGPGIALCVAAGNNGAFVDTRTAGAHTLMVTAISRDGLTTTRTVDYRVIPPPPNKFTISRKKLNHTTGVVTFNVSVPGAGAVKASETMLSAGKQVAAGRAHGSSRRKQTLHLKIKPNGRGLHLVRHHTQLVSVQLMVTFTPVGGTAHSMRFTLALPAPPVASTPTA